MTEHIAQAASPSDAPRGLTDEQQSAADDTRTRILDSAEDLIIERGYTAASLRAIANRAEVNLAATHYHFGSKFGLLAAVFHRRILPIDEARLRGLMKLQSRAQAPSIREIVSEFLAPLYEISATDSKLPQLAGRILGEPESLTRPLLEKEFGEMAAQYQLAFSRALPELSIQEIQWRFQFLVGAMIYLLRFQGASPLQPQGGSLPEGLDRLIEFATAGFALGRGEDILSEESSSRGQTNA